ncbi:HlyD family type I secretion periplasmic adaptor subunit [Parasphingopyxis sp.]|uniref:HlyD family type I secretion periplasmic adaptor subunit n=1 Tax=Parasphingopyxis sp. TaxID=1920299 RepID=UPI0026363020|nr:HlyD family type I secretion periplasmic adaptor subunit [Parasphingopyxis sp.]
MNAEKQKEAADEAAVPDDGPPDFLERLTSRKRPRAASNLLLWLIAGFFIAFIIWAALTELDQTIRGPGRVIPSSQMQVVSNLEGGIVEAILVNVGDQVSVGDPLVRLDNTQSASDLGSNRAQFDALNVKIARLQAELDGRQPRFPTPNNQSTREQIAIERSLHGSRMADLDALTAAARARITQSQRAANEAQASLTARQAAARAAQQEVDILRPLVERGIEPRFSLTQAENRVSIAMSETQAAAASVARAQASVAEAQASLTQARQQWRAQAADELARVQAQQSALRRSLPALSDRVRRTIIRAPLSGRVNRVMTATVGGTIGPGEPIAEIVPSEDSLIVEAMIRPSDIGQVSIGQRAEVGISAYESVVYGTLDGEVITISPDTTQDERTGENFYTVRVVTEGNLLDGDGNPVMIGPGMTADVSLLGGKQSILSYILTPITRLGRSALRE